MGQLASRLTSALIQRCRRAFAAKRCYIFEAPTEIRLLIYEFYFASLPVDPNFKHSDQPAILQTSVRIRSEAFNAYIVHLDKVAAEQAAKAARADRMWEAWEVIFNSCDSEDPFRAVIAKTVELQCRNVIHEVNSTTALMNLVTEECKKHEAWMTQFLVRLIEKNAWLAEEMARTYVQQLKSAETEDHDA
ncbi:Hypothetical predicted protein [Lecanosticta acicola]|uniref:Uncharacterized protein n=1 Tax=Lecanosticta acicola TaxID=111012 RepID=A0AAI8Z832_9PEZI|nr:Hypothetical predicted protein [Lecanosticta acicola]